MARVTADLIDGEVRRSALGDSVRRLFQVRELAGAPAARLVAATTASGVPRVGDPHPALPAVLVSDVRAAASRDPTIAIVEVSYAVPSGVASAGGGEVDIAIVSDLITEETITDVDGRTISTSYFSTSASGGTNTSTFTTQVHRIEVQRPTFAVVFSRVESRPPLSKARAYAGTVNASAYLDEPTDRWLCNIESSQESASAHRVRYSFTLNPKGWQAQVVHVNDGLVPADVKAVNGIEDVQVYVRTNFAALRLPRI